MRVHDPGAARARLVPGLVKDPEPVRAPRDAAVAQVRLEPRDARRRRALRAAHVGDVRHVARRRVHARVAAVPRLRPVQLGGLVRAPVDPPRPRAARVVHDGDLVRERQVRHLAHGLAGAVRHPDALREAPAGDLVRKRSKQFLQDDERAVGRRVAPRVHPRLAVPECTTRARFDVYHPKLAPGEVLEQVRVVRVLEQIGVRAGLRDDAAGVCLDARPSRRRRFRRPRRSVRGHHARRDGGGVEPGVGLEERVQTGAFRKYRARLERLHVRDPQLGGRAVGVRHGRAREANGERDACAVRRPSHVVDRGAFRDALERLVRADLSIRRGHRADGQAGVAGHARAAVLRLVDAQPRELQLRPG